MYFTQDDIKRIKEASKGRLLDVIGDFHELRKRGAEYKCECPKCHGQEKLHISPAKQIFKCFSCPDIKGKEPLDYLQRQKTCSSWKHVITWHANSMYCSTRSRRKRLPKPPK
jgi:hypothetical protein